MELMHKSVRPEAKKSDQSEKRNEVESLPTNPFFSSHNLNPLLAPYSKEQRRYQAGERTQQTNLGRAPTDYALLSEIPGNEFLRNFE